MTFNDKSDLPKRYQAIADQEGFKSVSFDLENTPATMEDVAVVEKRLEDARDTILELSHTVGDGRGAWKEIYSLKPDLLGPIPEHLLPYDISQGPYRARENYRKLDDKVATVKAVAILGHVLLAIALILSIIFL